MTDNLLTAEQQEPIEQTSTESPTDKPSNIPDKFWDNESKTIRTEALLNSYLALEKRLSKMLPMPENEDDKSRILKALGLPDTADQYQIDLKNDILDIDPELNARLHAKGFTHEQVQEIYDLATEKLVPMVLNLAAEFQADRELERLVTQFGGAEKWAITAKQLQEYGQKNLPPSAYEGLCCSYDGVMALHNMMKNNIQTPLSAKDGAANDIADEASLRQMMQSPKYWRDRDPSYIAKVSEGFKRLYGER